MVNSPILSIIVPAYNASSTIRRCIGSLVGQTERNIEILLIDDGSTDDTLSLCEELAARDARVKVFSKLNEGQGLARNYGIKLAKGKYISFVDADDSCSSTMYELLLESAINNSADITVCGYTDVLDDTVVCSHPVESFVLTEKEQKQRYMADLVSELGRDSGSGCIAVWDGIYRRSLLEDNQVFFPSERRVYSEDLVFKLRALSHSQRICSVPQCLYEYHINSGSFSKNTDSSVIGRLKFMYETLSDEFSSLLRAFSFDERNKNRLFISLRYALKGVPDGDARRAFVTSLVQDSVLFEYLDGYVPTNLLNTVFYWALKTRNATICHVLLSCLKLKG